MGYYSFYKIIKDVIRTLFGSRIFKYFIIITIILLFLFITGKMSFADATLPYLINNTENNILDVYNLTNYYTFFYATKYYTDRGQDYCTYQLITCDHEFVINKINNNYPLGTIQIPIGAKYGNGTGLTTSSQLQNSINNLNISNNNPTSNVYNINIDSNSYTAYNSISSDDVVVFTTFDIKDSNGNIVYHNSTDTFVYPYLTPSATDIQNLNFENLFVELGDYDLDENSLYLHALQIVNSVPENNEVLYYYSDNVFSLDKKSDYYHQLLDTSNYYFAIPKETINFGVDKSYLLVLTNKKSLEMNSIGLYEKDEGNGFFDVVLVDTSGIVTDSEVINNNLNNLNNNINNINNNLNPNSSINQNVTIENQEEIDSNLNFNNHNQQLESINSNFLSRLLNLVSDLADYDTSTTYVDIPMPYSNKSLRLRSDVISGHLSQGLKNLISAMWFYMFTFYMYSYINKIYIALSTGKIIETFTSKGEVITNDML